MDPRMGTTDRTLRCTTCGGCMKVCLAISATCR